MKKYSVALHSRNDASLIDYIEGRKSKGDTISTIFREAIEALIKEG